MGIAFHVHFIGGRIIAAQRRVERHQAIVSGIVAVNGQYIPRFPPFAIHLNRAAILQVAADCGFSDTQCPPRHNVHITCSGDISRHHTAVMDINVLTCHINGRVGTESNFPPHDIRRTLIRRGIVVKSQDPGTQFCHITATADTVRHRPATLSGDGEQAIIDNGSITQVFLLVDAERAACINVELPHKAAIIAIQLYICPGGCAHDTLPAYAIAQFASHVF